MILAEQFKVLISAKPNVLHIHLEKDAKPRIVEEMQERGSTSSSS